jgi:hypothetical protein
VATSATYSSNKRFFLNLANPTHALVIDPQGAATMVYAPEPQNEFIIDNGGSGYTQTGGWTNLTNTLAFQLDYDYAAAGSGRATATWSFNGIPNGSYQVFARWIPFVNRATNAPFTILNGTTPISTVLVNQQLPPNDDQSNAVTWKSLGTFSTTVGALAVRLANDANGYVIADAVRIVANGIPPQVPEMDVAGFDHSIDTGDLAPALDDATDFGPTALLVDSTEHAFTISNNGNAPLHLTGTPPVVISGAHAADFLLVSQPAAIIGPGQKTTFRVIFHPLGAGLRTALVSIANNDDTEHPYTFALQGTGVEAAPPPPPPALAHNAAWPEDVNADDRVSPRDVLIVINELMSQAEATSAAPLAATAAEFTTSTYYVDVTGDGRVTTRDVLVVVNYLLNAPSAAPVAAGVDVVASALGATWNESAGEAPPRPQMNPVVEKAVEIPPSVDPPMLLTPESVRTAPGEADEGVDLLVVGADIDLAAIGLFE